MNQLRYQREVDETVEAADYALKCLRQAKSELQSASNFGLWDMLGGGMFVTFAKRNKMSKAQESMNEAKSALSRFSKELNMVDRRYALNLDLDGFLGFADYFFDGIVADVLVQNKIDEAKKEVDQAIREVESIRKDLLIL
jgi:hypothetical protein